MSINDVAIESESRAMVPFKLALDDKTQAPMYTSHFLPPIHISPYSISEEARYASIIPEVGAVFAQTDLSGGLGKKLEVRSDMPGFDRYHYGDWMDMSVPGQGQKGPAVTTMSAPSNSGPMTGYYELAGVPYLVLSRRIASWGGASTLNAAYDYTAGIAGGQAAVFSKMAAAATVETSSTTSTTSTLTSVDDRLAQSFRLDDSGSNFLSSVTVLLTRTGTMVGDVRLSIMADLNGKPSMQIITSSSMAASQVPTSATSMTFRFDDDATLALPYNLPFWIVLDAVGATAAITMAWSRSSASDVYSGGLATGSLDRGNTWTAIAVPSDFYFIVSGKLDTTTAFVATTTDGQFFTTTPDGTTYTADSARFSNHFVVVGGILIRSIQLHGAGTSGLIDTSSDGANWSSDSIVVGDPNVPITNLLAMGDVLVVCKENGVYAVDILGDFTVEPIYVGGRVSTNGLGSNCWRGAAYIPLNGRLAALTGDFTNGFVFHESIGLESLPEWDAPWGAGQHVAVVGTRFHLYSAVSSSSGYRLVKSANPLKVDKDNLPDPDWHGSLATIGDGSQSITCMGYFDPGGTSSPQLFMTTTGNSVARITMPRSFNPASDPAYSYDISTTGSLFLSRAHGNYPVHPKAWLSESVTFQQSRPNDYVECMYDDLLGEGYRRLPKGRLYDTGVLVYPSKLSVRTLARQIRLTNSVITASPLLLAFGVSYAVRHIEGAAIKEISFTVEVEDGLSAATLGNTLGLGAVNERTLLSNIATSGGTRRFTDPYGTTYERTLFLDATDITQDLGETGGKAHIQMNAVAIV